jgi:hypothetical protein
MSSAESAHITTSAVAALVRHLEEKEGLTLSDQARTTLYLRLPLELGPIVRQALQQDAKATR